MQNIKKIGFWGYPNPEIVEELEKQNPEWIDLDIDFGHPKTNILPEAYCKIIRNIIDNSRVVLITHSCMFNYFQLVGGINEV